jgi:hypothetical protein
MIRNLDQKLINELIKREALLRTLVYLLHDIYVLMFPVNIIIAWDVNIYQEH